MIIRILLLFIISISSAHTQPDYKAWDVFLKKYVTASGEVNYTAIKAKRGDLDAIVKSFENTKVETSWSKDDQLAFWINAYNVFTVKLIVDNFPLKSIQNLDKGKTWDVQRFVVGGNKFSLNNIENDIIRARFKDARIHFAVNCAAKSCPPLLNGAFFSKTLDKQLTDQTVKFFNNSKYQNITAASVSLSKIMDWYRSDFGNMISFINQYSKTKVNSNAKISFLEYDWALNGK
ncbi:MAG: DUF547 domain-containing protein [Saprospiraceae bacterium]